MICRPLLEFGGKIISQSGVQHGALPEFGESLSIRWGQPMHHVRIQRRADGKRLEQPRFFYDRVGLYRIRSLIVDTKQTTIVERTFQHGGCEVEPMVRRRNGVAGKEEHERLVHLRPYVRVGQNWNR